MSKGKKDVVRLLLERGADPNIACDEEDYWIPLHHVAYEGDKDLVKLLMEHGADPHQKNKDGYTALDAARDGEHCGIIHMILTWDPLPDTLEQTRTIRMQ